MLNVSANLSAFLFIGFNVFIIFVNKSALLGR